MLASFGPLHMPRAIIRHVGSGAHVDGDVVSVRMHTRRVSELSIKPPGLPSTLRGHTLLSILLRVVSEFCLVAKMVGKQSYVTAFAAVASFHMAAGAEIDSKQLPYPISTFSDTSTYCIPSVLLLDLKLSDAAAFKHETGRGLQDPFPTPSQANA